MARKKKVSPVKKFAVIGGILAVLQIGFIVFFQSDSGPKTAMEAINDAVGKMEGVTTERRMRAKVQLAIVDYMATNGGSPPPSLKDLVPKYFDQVPVNPETNQPFEYRVDGSRYQLVGSDEPEQASGDKKKAPGSGENNVGSATKQELLIASLDEPADSDTYIYDPAGRRDPFRPFDLTPDTTLDENRTELETYDIGQLKLTAVLEGFEEPTAIVENSAGRGFTVRKGTKIGLNSGEVIDIKTDKLIILETSVDFTGTEHQHTLEMKLRVKGATRQ